MIYSQPEIATALNKQAAQFVDFVKPLDKAAFENMPGGKWSAGQHLDHLIRSIKPVNLAFTVPAFYLSYKFGKNNRAGRTYNELVQRYNEKIQAGGKASGAFIPPEISHNDSQNKLATFLKEYKKLGDKTQRMSDAKLDTYLVPHPLLGRVTLREILFFTVYHTELHLDILMKRG